MRDGVRAMDPFDHEDDEVKKHWNETADKTAEFIKQNCKSWLMIARNNVRDIVYRGFEKIPNDYLTFTRAVRQDRAPRDSSVAIHDLYNRMIDLCDKHANRNNSVFCSGSHAMASQYGTVYVIIPIGNFRYTWHLDCEDWYESRYKFERELGLNPSDQKITAEFCPRLMGDDDGTWAQAVASGHEIMIACKSYLAIHPRFYAAVAERVK